MWIERVDIVIVSLHRDFVPSAWGNFVPTIWDWATLAGTIGFFALAYLLFIRYLPLVAMSDMAKLIADLRGKPAAARHG
jgi:Ni/Fe-hydrogenase subunit HybB-like protein